jgi:hypothetical protein
MKEIILPITVSLLIISLAGCSLLPPSGTLPTSTPASPSIPTSGYEPQSGDDKLKRDQVFLEAGNSSVVTMESYPVQVSVVLNGNLSDPCHQLRVMISPANAQNEIKLDVYSVVDPSVACITVLKPFTANVPLGNYAGGHYMVYVNGQLFGEFDA